MANEALMAAYVPPPFKSSVTYVWPVAWGEAISERAGSEASPHVFSAHGDSHKLYNQPMGTRRKIRILHIGAGACALGRQSRGSHAVPRLWRNQHGVSGPEVDEGRRDCLLWSVAARQLGRPGLNSCAEKNTGVGGTVSPSWTCL
jgi:hypothetical protein